jgi:two-component system sensor histidine kinase DesK
MVSADPWLSRPRRVALSALFLVYLLYVATAVADRSGGASEAVGLILLGVFAAAYLEMVDRAPRLSGGAFAVGVVVLLALMVCELPFAHAAGLNMSLYITALVVARVGRRALPAVFAFAVAALVVPTLISSWHDSFADSIGLVTPIAVPVVALVSLGLRGIAEANFALAEARAEVSRLSADAERARIARDLHDLLGHSLTTITVKAGLAHRIVGRDPQRAASEIAGVEDVARRTLQDVRAAVAGYRQVTLAGELAAGQELLRAAGIKAELPRAVDAVDSARGELLGWVVREGLTNVVRHAHASSCALRLTSTCIEIIDDGDGRSAATAHEPRTRRQPATTGHGLTGLRERVAAAGGHLEVGPLSPCGWRLRVSLPDSIRS